MSELLVTRFSLLVEWGHGMGVWGHPFHDPIPLHSILRIAGLRKFYEYRKWQSKVVFETNERYSTLVFCIGAFCSALAV